MSAAPTVTPRRWSRHVVRAGLGALAAALVLTLAVVAAALAAGRLPGTGTWTLTPVVASAVAAAALWPVARRWAGDVAARLLHGGVRSPEEVVRAFSRRASREAPDDELLVQLAEALVRTMRAASAEVWRADATGRMIRAVSIPNMEPVAVTVDGAARSVLSAGGVVGRAWLEMWLPVLLGDRPFDEVRVAPATYGGELLGLVVVSRLPSAERFNDHEEASLAELGSRLGVLLHNRNLDATLQQTLDDLRRTNDELRASRGRLVSTADSERRRIERNLHDGAQQHLVALAVNLRLAAEEIAADPAAAPTALADLGRGVQEAIDELRSLAHGIYPPVLMDAGLLEALRVSARRSTSPVAVTQADVGRYPPDTEAAIYFCCMEALQNAAKHAPGAPVRLHLADDGHDLRFTVEDDGPGIAPDAPRGHGLTNMEDRIVAVGGSLLIERSRSGGTRVEGRIPSSAIPPKTGG